MYKKGYPGKKFMERELLVLYLYSYSIVPPCHTNFLSQTLSSAHTIVKNMSVIKLYTDIIIKSVTDDKTKA